MTAGAELRASVVIPAFNRRDLLERTLDGFLDQTVPAHHYEIIVVDDASVDDTGDYVQRRARSVSNLACIRHPENKGQGAARNTGIRAARGAVVILNDNDITPARDYVEAHLRRHARHGAERVAVIGNLSFAEGSIRGSNFGRFCQSRYLGHRSRLHRIGLDYAQLPPQFFGGGIASVRRADLLAVGLFDERIHHYGGEDEYVGYLLARSGVRIVFEAGARVVHHDTPSLTRYRRKMIEVARHAGGHRVLLEEAREYFETTPMRFLLPIDAARDSWLRILGKLAIRAALNPWTVAALERWAALTDRRPWAYSSALYRALMAGWHLQGQRATDAGIRLVTYGSAGMPRER